MQTQNSRSDFFNQQQARALARRHLPACREYDCWKILKWIVITKAIHH